MIKILALCAALLAPESSGLDPHGRALHLELHADFNISYEACITTSKQARKYGIDPFVSTALMYKITKFSPKLAKTSKVFRNIRKIYGCGSDSGQFIRSSCSAFMLFAPHFSEILQNSRAHVGAPMNYRASLYKFLQSDHGKAKIIENMAKRFADVYSRTHTYYAWSSPFNNIDQDNLNDSRHAYNEYQEPLRDPRLEALLQSLRRPQPYDYQNQRLHQKMEYDLQLLYSILGPGIKIEARSRDFSNPEYYIHLDSRNLKEILLYVAGNISSRHKPHTFQEYDDGKFILLLNAPRVSLIFTPYSQYLYVATVK